jgi:hypothetical protein
MKGLPQGDRVGDELSESCAECEDDSVKPPPWLLREEEQEHADQYADEAEKKAEDGECS